MITTTPVTQNRDYKLYDWPTRHAEVLARHRAVKPDLIFIADSLIHYWGGEPAAVVVHNADAWQRCFSGFTITNMGFGWDRTENVLWRLQNGELDGIDPKAVLIKIGTNNVGLNPPGEIASGIVAIVQTVRQKLPASKILLFGILPRLDNNVPAEVNALLAAKYADDLNVYFYELGDALKDARGQPRRELYRDDVHINAEGYDLIAPLLREAVLASV